MQLPVSALPVLVVLCACHAPFVLTAFTPTPTEQFENHVVLDSSQDYHLYWKFNSTIITFEIHVQTTGWIGFGLSSSGTMTGADIVMGWVAGNTPSFYDMHATSQGRPQLDEEQNWWVTNGMQTGNVTMLRFYRHLISCDTSGQDMDIKDSTQRLIYAYGPSTPADVTSVPKHANHLRSTLSVRLLIPQQQRVTLPNNTWHHDITHQSFRVPSNDTTYWCSIYSFPNPNTKQHMIRIEPIVTPGNERLVHHMILYHCSNNINQSVVGTGGICLGRNMPEYDCNIILGAWGIGGEAYDLPTHVGLPVGLHYGPEYVLLEMHYDNPGQLSTYVDSSGMRLYMTPTLRPDDAGVMMIGAFIAPTLLIPPLEADFKTYGHCNSQCLSEGMSNTSVSSIHVISALLHSHLLGRKLNARVIRNGQEVANLGIDDYYDFNLQEFRALSSEAEIMPGDEIITECGMDSTGRTGVTYGGLSTNEEMCLTFFYYYPRIPLLECMSGMDERDMLLAMGATSVKWDSLSYQWVAATPSAMAGQSALSVSQGYSWSSASVRSQYQAQVTSARYDGWCRYMNGTEIIQNLNLPSYTPAPADPTPDYCGEAGMPSLTITAAAVLILALLMF